MRARFAGRCAACGGRVGPGDEMYWHRRTKAVEHASCHEAEAPAIVAPAFTPAPEPRRESPRMDTEYAAGVSDANTYLSDKAMFGDAMADAFALEAEFAAFNRGDDY